MGEDIMAKSNEYIDRWKKDNVTKYSFYVNNNTESDVNEWLKGISNRRQYLIGLIRKDMNGLLPSKAQESGQTTEEPGKREI